MLRPCFILLLVSLSNSHLLIAQDSDQEIKITSQIDQFLLEHRIEPDSLISIGNWSYSDGFFSSHIEVKTNGRFKSNGSTCFGRHGGPRGKWFISDGQLYLKSLSKVRNPSVYVYQDNYVMIEPNDATVQEIKVLASDIYRQKPMSKEDLWSLVKAMVLIKQREELDSQTP